jgi:hypothetical protein
MGVLSARGLYVIPAVMVLWDWLHGAVFGVVILGAFVAAETGKQYLARHFSSVPGLQQLPAARLRSLYLALGATLAVMVLNPYGLRSYGIFFEFVGDNSLVPEVNEFQPPGWDNYATYFVALGLCTLALLVRWRSIDLTGLLVAAPFVYLSLRYSRATGVSALVLVPVVATALAARPRVASRAPIMGIAARVAPAVVLASILAYIGYAKFIRTDWNYTFGFSELSDFNPVGSTRFVIENGLMGNLYNSGNVGGYLSFHITPTRKIFQYNHHTVFGNTVRFLRDPDELAQWNINYGIASLANEMTLLFPRADWARVYVEPSAAVVVRRNEANRDLISRYELRYFNPHLPSEKLVAMARDPGARGRLLTEMADYLRYRNDAAVCDVLVSLLGDTVPRQQEISLETVRTYLKDGPAKNGCLDRRTES